MLVIGLCLSSLWFVGQTPQRPQSINPPNLPFRPPYAPYMAAGPHVLRGFAPIQQSQQQQSQQSSQQSRQPFSQPTLPPTNTSSSNPASTTIAAASNSSNTPRQSAFTYSGPSPTVPISNQSQSHLLNVGVLPHQSEPRLDPNDFPALGAPSQQPQQSHHQYSQVTAPSQSTANNNSSTLNQDDFPALSSDQQPTLNGVSSQHQKHLNEIRQPFYQSNNQSHTPAQSFQSQRDKRVSGGFFFIDLLIY